MLADVLTLQFDLTVLTPRIGSKGTVSGQEDEAGGGTEKSADKGTTLQGGYTRAEHCPPDMTDVGTDDEDASPREAHRKEVRGYTSSGLAEGGTAADRREEGDDPQATRPSISGEAAAGDLRERHSTSASEELTDNDQSSAETIVVSGADDDGQQQERLIGSDEVLDADSTVTPREYSMRELVVTGDFYLLFACLFLTAAPGVFVAGEPHYWRGLFLGRSKVER